MARTLNKTTDEWIRDIFPVTYPDHLPSSLSLLSCVKPSGQKVAVWDRMFYLQHRTDTALSFFIVEYGIPLRKGAVDMIATYIYDTCCVFSKIGHETESVDMSTAYDNMIQELRRETKLHSFDLPIHILLTYPLKPTMIKYLHTIHEGIGAYEYDEFAWSLCMSDGQQCVFDDMMVVNRVGSFLKNAVYHGDGMLEIYEWLKENDLLHRVDPRAKPYLTPYRKMQWQLDGLKGCVEVGHLVSRKVS